MTETEYDVREWTPEATATRAEFVATVKPGDLVTLTVDGDTLPEKPLQGDSVMAFGSRWSLQGIAVSRIAVRTPKPATSWIEQHATVVMDRDGDVWEKSVYGWRSLHFGTCTHAALCREDGPLTPLRDDRGRTLLSAEQIAADALAVWRATYPGLKNWADVRVRADTSYRLIHDALTEAHGYPEDAS